TQTGRAVGDGQADQVGLAGLGKVGLHLDGGVNLLPLLVQGDQRFGGFDLGEQGQLLLAGDLDFLSLHGQHVAVAAKHGIRGGPLDVFAVHAGTVGVAAVGGGDVLDPAALDFAAVRGRA